ncbi:hypothetical protein LB564_30910 [Mesorhizobium sp. ES1-6]|nr:hypothetical protein [Mesorhizobium sp. ES1-6]MBZ9806155.1 hypothetical protein [Mesorhizobium sp. ES1-6]
MTLQSLGTGPIKVLEALGLQSWPLLSGGKGVHAVVPLVPEADWDEVKSFCQHFAELLVRTDPSRFVAKMSMFEVPAGGHRYRALELLVKQKPLAKTEPVPCVVTDAHSAVPIEEDSLACDRLRMHGLRIRYGGRSFSGSPA